MRKTIHIITTVLLVFLIGTMSSQAATRVVDRLDDDPTKTSCTGTVNDCSLRGAITGALPGDVITFGLSGTAQILTELLINKNITITGNGETLTIIEPEAGVSDLRIFHVSPGVTAVIENLTAQKGAVEYENGAGILNEGTLTFNQVTVSECTVTGAYSGGGLYHNGTLLTLNDCSITGNEANGGGGLSLRAAAEINRSHIRNNVARAYYGGGAHAASSSAVVVIRDSDIRDNQAQDFNGGGIAASDSASLSLLRCEVSGNQCYGGGAYRGGGVYSRVSIFSAVNTTFSGNLASGDGGGVAIDSGGTESQLSFCTLYDNYADIDHDETGDGGGLWALVPFSYQFLRLKGNVIAYNTDSSSTTKAPDVYTSGTYKDTNVISLGRNFVSTNQGDEALFPQGAPNANRDYAGTGVTAGTGVRLDPKLLSLADNGGNTKTHALT